MGRALTAAEETNVRKEGHHARSAQRAIARNGKAAGFFLASMENCPSTSLPLVYNVFPPLFRERNLVMQR